MGGALFAVALCAVQWQPPCVRACALCIGGGRSISGKRTRRYEGIETAGAGMEDGRRGDTQKKDSAIAVLFLCHDAMDLSRLGRGGSDGSRPIGDGRLRGEEHDSPVDGMQPLVFGRAGRGNFFEFGFRHIFGRY